MEKRTERENETAAEAVDIEQKKRSVTEQKHDMEQPDWIKEHIAKYGKEPNLFDGC